MRKIISVSIIGLAVMSLTACKKSFVEQANPNGVSVDNGIKTENDVTAAVYGVYQALRSSNAIGEGASLWTDDRADDINTTDNQSNNGEPFQFSAFALVPGNSYLQSHWSALYVPIARANLVLSIIDKISFASEATKTQYIAELKFIRAYMYYNLVREFGDVPLVTERLSSEEQAASITARVKKEQVYAQIVADLKDVVGSNLPVVQPVASKGKVSLQAANATLGQVYLTMATTLADNKIENLNNAKTYLLACFNQKTFGSLSEIPFADVFDVSKKSTNAEIIWQIVYKQGDPSYSSALARNNQAKGETINSPFVSQGSGGLFTKDLLNEFEAGDIRTTFSVKFAASSNAYFITKFRDASSAATTLGYGGNDWILIRYADVILNLAEVSMYLNDNASAISYLNMVRTRAQRPNYAIMMADPAYAAKYPTLKLAILHERRVELAFEHHRWHDLVRFFNAEQLVEYFKAKKQADYDNSPLANMTTKDYYFPIPFNEFKLDPVKMYQNPGY
ncbi:RagB/SusD family nutrient uptake outer membrane protein [Terrimonas sp. NA20]|uniref:RagB/SusD family nutrient uptake outer membrane protein n=1 Tax=Terrimonas ginsenosidimutans TaxID=2908004 RepID=A0ABS9KLL9_9BACT|nr:RagB/SusD family nutrient uptake outer membrane protein [Terrimonas ginsenosidimutans]MCG2613223.1 RagB/SusD family nutrient uptake outer membrane protein [Terrimonas ginsenosidimutans]